MGQLRYVAGRVRSEDTLDPEDPDVFNSLSWRGHIVASIELKMGKLTLICTLTRICTKIKPHPLLLICFGTYIHCRFLFAPQLTCTFHKPDEVLILNKNSSPLLLVSQHHRLESQGSNPVKLGQECGYDLSNLGVMDIQNRIE